MSAMPERVYTKEDAEHLITLATAALESALTRMTEERDGEAAEREKLAVECNALAGMVEALRAEVEALVPLARAAPNNLSCEDFHHTKADHHEVGEQCPPYERYYAALGAARALLARRGKEGA